VCSAAYFIFEQDFIEDFQELAAVSTTLWTVNKFPCICCCNSALCKPCQVVRGCEEHS